jgi:hypothetical protein
VSRVVLQILVWGSVLLIGWWNPVESVTLVWVCLCRIGWWCAIESFPFLAYVLIAVLRIPEESVVTVVGCQAIARQMFVLRKG